MENGYREGRFGAPPAAIERRTLVVPSVEVREADSGLRVAGYAAVFGKLSEPLGGFREIIQRGAFRPALDERPEIRFMVNHGAGLGLPLANTANGTLRLAEDALGLRFLADLVDTSEARDLYEVVSRGDLRTMSFAFSLDRDEGGMDRWDATDTGMVRTVIAVSGLFEISAATFAAYPHTSIGAAA